MDQKNVVMDRAEEEKKNELDQWNPSCGIQVQK